MVESEENDKFDLRVIGLMIQENYDQSIGSKPQYKSTV